MRIVLHAKWPLIRFGLDICQLSPENDMKVLKMIVYLFKVNCFYCQKSNRNFSVSFLHSQVIGEPCGYHGPYTFYKGIRISPSSATNDHENNCGKKVNCFDGIDNKTAELLRSNDTIIKSIKHEYDSESSSYSIDDLPLPRKYNKTEVKPRLLAEW